MKASLLILIIMFFSPSAKIFSIEKSSSKCDTNCHENKKTSSQAEEAGMFCKYFEEVKAVKNIESGDRKSMQAENDKNSNQSCKVGNSDLKRHKPGKDWH